MSAANVQNFHIILALLPPPRKRTSLIAAVVDIKILFTTILKNYQLSTIVLVHAAAADI